MATVTQTASFYGHGEHKKYLRMHNTSDPEADGLQQRRTTSDSTCVSQKENLRLVCTDI